MTIVVEGVVDAAIENVWSVISDFANLQRWHPGVLSCQASGSLWGTERILMTTAGLVVERLEAVDVDAHTIVYKVVTADTAEFRDMVGMIALQGRCPTSTLVRWTAAFVGPAAALADVEQRMATYYEQRIGHLRSAVREEASGNVA